MDLDVLRSVRTTVKDQTTPVTTSMGPVPMDVRMVTVDRCVTQVGKGYS